MNPSHHWARLNLVQGLDTLGAEYFTDAFGAFQYVNRLNVGIEAMLGAALGMADAVADH